MRQVQCYRKFHLSGDLTHKLQGNVASQVAKLQSLLKQPTPGQTDIRTVRSTEETTHNRCQSGDATGSQPANGELSHTDVSIAVTGYRKGDTNTTSHKCGDNTKDNKKPAEYSNTHSRGKCHKDNMASISELQEQLAKEKEESTRLQEQVKQLQLQSELDKEKLRQTDIKLQMEKLEREKEKNAGSPGRSE